MLVELVDVAELGLGTFDDDFKLTLGGGALSILVLSSLGGGGAGGADEEGVCWEMPLVVGFFGRAALLVLPLGDAGSEFTVGGGGMTRLGPFIGRDGVASASTEG